MSTHRRGRSCSVMGWRLALTLGGVATAFPLTAIAECKYDLNGVGYPYGAGEVCPYRGPGSARSYAPQGPSPEELRRRAEEKDLAEAADDAEDKGERAYRKGDWAGAISDFKDALSYAPDDPVIATNLQIAMAKWRDVQDVAKRTELKTKTENSPTGQQLATTVAQQPIAPGDAIKRAAGNVFDNGVKPTAKLTGPVVPILKSDPLVPYEKRTTKIIALENDRAAAREHIAALDQKVSSLDVKNDASVIAAMKQDKVETTNKVRKINLSIESELSPSK